MPWSPATVTGGPLGGDSNSPTRVGLQAVAGPVPSGPSPDKKGQRGGALSAADRHRPRRPCRWLCPHAPWLRSQWVGAYPVAPNAPPRCEALDHGGPGRAQRRPSSRPEPEAESRPTGSSSPFRPRSPKGERPSAGTPEDTAGCDDTGRAQHVRPGRDKRPLSWGPAGLGRGLRGQLRASRGGSPLGAHAGRRVCAAPGDIASCSRPSARTRTCVCPRARESVQNTASLRRQGCGSSELSSCAQGPGAHLLQNDRDPQHLELSVRARLRCGHAPRGRPRQHKMSPEARLSVRHRVTADRAKSRSRVDAGHSRTKGPWHHRDALPASLCHPHRGFTPPRSKVTAKGSPAKSMLAPASPGLESLPLLGLSWPLTSLAQVASSQKRL